MEDNLCLPFGGVSVGVGFEGRCYRHQTNLTQGYLFELEHVCCIWSTRTIGYDTSAECIVHTLNDYWNS